MANTENGKTTVNKGDQNWEAAAANSRGTYSGFVTGGIIATVAITLILIGMAVFLL